MDEPVVHSGRGRILPPVKRRYLELRFSEGYPRTEACRVVNVSYGWAKKVDAEHLLAIAAQPSEEDPDANPAKLPDELNPEAAKALEDIGVFARRYFGVQLMPFQKYATDKVVELLATDDEEYLLLNVAPGTGKSTFFMLILPAWLTARDRLIRGICGSATDTLARGYLANLKDALTTPLPLQADPQMRRLGIQKDADAALSVDYGRFRPVTRDRKWSEQAIFVDTAGTLTAQKEASWSAFGRTSAFIGIRTPVVLWDDLYDPEKMRTAESRDALKRWWFNVAEKRVEPGGLLLLQGQRLDPDDIYAFAKDMEGTIVSEDDPKPRKYHHIKFKAHYPEHCAGDHGPDARPYDPAKPLEGGCLLFPKRLGFEKLQTEQANNPDYDMVFDQADASKRRALVQRLWIDGGTDYETREVFIGCKDVDRRLGEPPAHMPAGLIASIATVDPSPTKQWSMQHWLVRIDAELGPMERWLVDLKNEAMQVSEVIDYLIDGRIHVGHMQEWQQRSVEWGYPITHWIVEQNAAQRFMLAFDHFQKWMMRWGVQVLGHETHKNKSDPEFGVQTIGTNYKHGRVRLPYARETAYITERLVRELVFYPGATDDNVMGNWFLEWYLPWIADELLDAQTGDDDDTGHLWRPDFMGGPHTLTSTDNDDHDHRPAIQRAGAYA